MEKINRCNPNIPVTTEEVISMNKPRSSSRAFWVDIAITQKAFVIAYIASIRFE